VAEAWSPEKVVDAALASALVGERFAELAGAAVESLGVGFDNTAYLIGGWVFRFPRREVAAGLLEREARLLPALAPRLPLPVPVPERFVAAAPDARFPWPWAGHRLVPGRTACAGLDDAARARAAPVLGRFLRALHDFPVDQALALGAPRDEIGRMDVAQRRARAELVLGELSDAGALDAATRRRIEGVLAEAPDATDPAGGGALLVHGDLYARHLLCDAGGRLCGVIDWGDIHVGERALDLAIAPRFLPPGARDDFRAAYGDIDAATWALARFRAAYHAANVVRFARACGDRALEREESLALGWM